MSDDAPVAGVLTPEIVARALDELWNPPVPLPPGGYRGGREPFGTVPVTVKPPEWTVEADGWRLVIRDGAIVGLERTLDYHVLPEWAPAQF